ncbi:MAG: transcriptional regulator [Thermoprotei archaeon]|nr:MAG: transcriptional regulator [Thermoprotei archaeon]
METLTLRRRIISLLRKTDHFLTAYQIIRILGIDIHERELYEHLKHVARTIWRTSGGRERLVMRLPRCRSCGFVFTDLEEPWRPSKCPRCGSRLIEPPAFAIIREK